MLTFTLFFNPLIKFLISTVNISGVLTTHVQLVLVPTSVSYILPQLNFRLIHVPVALNYL